MEIISENKNTNGKVVNWSNLDQLKNISDEQFNGDADTSGKNIVPGIFANNIQFNENSILTKFISR
jgi:hypothetical protein